MYRPSKSRTIHWGKQGKTVKVRIIEERPPLSYSAHSTPFSGVFYPSRQASRPQGSCLDSKLEKLLRNSLEVGNIRCISNATEDVKIGNEGVRRRMKVHSKTRIWVEGGWR